MNGTTSSTRNILLISDDQATVSSISIALEASSQMLFSIERCHRLADGIDRLAKPGIAAILLDTDLPDSQGMETVERLLAASNTIPLLVLGKDGQDWLSAVIQRGAQDYLLPTYWDSQFLPRAISHAIQRKVLDETFYVNKDRALLASAPINIGEFSVNEQGLISTVDGVESEHEGMRAPGHNLVDNLEYSQKIFDAVSNGITICDARQPDLPLIYVNAAFESISGYTAKESCGRNCRFLQGTDTNQVGVESIREAIRQRQSTRVLLKNYKKNGQPFWNELYLSTIFDATGELTHFIGIQNDVTTQVESAERLNYLAHHDILTGLANRGLLMEQMDQALLRAKRRNGRVAVLFFDLDRFKEVNDIYGHDFGDGLIQSVAKKLRMATRASETVARLGGDEFIVVLEYLEGDANPAEVMSRLISKIGEPVTLFDQVFYATTSVGLAIYPKDGDNPRALLKVADHNMYIAKRAATDVDRSGQEAAEVKSVGAGQFSI
jgi:diguanylate cyclase (GGDEF)-like protein/PAS domain S-box-containing protein